MEELTKAQKSRMAIRNFKITADALALRGYYRPSGRSGQKLEEALRTLSPEIYGSMNDSRTTELKGLEYVLDRLPRGIERCTRIILTAQEELEDTSFEKIVPLKRRRSSYRVSDHEMCFVITRGLSEVYDILTHLTFLNVEAWKLRNQMFDEAGAVLSEWHELEADVNRPDALEGNELDRAVWNLSKLLGRSYHETRETFMTLESSRREFNSNNGLFRIVHDLGKRVEEEVRDKENALMIHFTPSLRDMLGHHRCAESWADVLKDKLGELGLLDRPLHIISANLHSVVNLLYGHAVVGAKGSHASSEDLYPFIERMREKDQDVKAYAAKHGLFAITDRSGTYIDCQIIDTAALGGVRLHPAIAVDKAILKEEKPVILVIDYAFGTQSFEVMDELLKPFGNEQQPSKLNVRSISVMGKAGILMGQKGDIMLATAHVLEGTPHNYTVSNDLRAEDFDGSVNVFVGPIVTVLGTSLQNRDVLEKFKDSSWQAVGLEMEGGHYQRAISAAIIRSHISSDVKVRYAYYASDNPLISGQTLAAGSMGKEGIKPTYMITKVILDKILNPEKPAA